MPRSRFRFVRLALFLPLLPLLFLVCPAETAEKDLPQVRLAVLVVFDQLRGDYLERWDTLFGDGGFHRLEQDGVWFQNCHYPYAGTVTAAGHSSLATGTSAYKHGVIFNEWYDRKQGEEVYCVGQQRYERVPKAPEGKESKSAKRGQGNPDRLLAPTLGDTLKEATGNKAMVVSLSMKDRSAVLLGGHRPDACYWFDPVDGNFVTSTYYRDRVHGWVDEYNRSRPADAIFGKDWTRLRPDLDYEKYSGPDDVVGEDTGVSQGRTFPHSMTGGLTKPGRKSYEAMYNSPFGNDVLLGLVKRAIDAEKLGQHDAPDLLCISFSCNDPVGHNWGPDSQEVFDTTLRSDLVVKDLLAYLDAKVGKGKYALALSADHGVCPLPEVAVKKEKDAKRYLLTVAPVAEATAFLEKTFPKPAAGKPIVHIINESIYLNPTWVKAQGVPQEQIEKALAEWLKARPGVQTAYTRSQLMKGIPEDDKIGRMVWRSFYPERSGDVMIVVKPYTIAYSRLAGTGHGTPHEYDTHVPLLVFGPGLNAGARKDAVTPQANAPILAAMLGIKPPAQCDAMLPEKVFKAW